MSKPATIDEYLATLDEAQRTALQTLRETIRQAAPEAEECISYKIPAFRQQRMLVSFGVSKKHCALYLMSDATLDSFRGQLEGLDTSKGTIRFRPEKPLPQELVRKLVKARLKENAALDKH